MTLQINMRAGQAVNGGPGIGLLTSAGNPWSLPDALAQELVNRGVATAAAASVDNSAISYVIPPGWADRWKAKLASAQAGVGLARLACVGDSLTVGYVSSDLNNKSWAGLVRASLQAAYGDGGSGFCSSVRTVLGSGGANANTAAQLANGSFIAVTGSWLQGVTVTDGPAANALTCNAAGGTASYQVRGKLVEVFIYGWGTSTGATYSISIDGVGQGTFDSANQGTSKIIRQAFTPTPTAGDLHNITVTAVSTAPGNLFVCGFRGANPTGVVVDNYGRGGFTSRAFANGTNYTYPNSTGATYGGTLQGTFGEAGKWSGGSSNPADLVIYSMGLNDSRPAGLATTPDAYLGNLRDFLNDVKDGGTQNGQTDVMIVMQHAGQLSWQEASTKYYASYCERAQDLARAYGAAFVNLWSLGYNSYNWMLSQGYMGDFNNPGAAGTDAVHLSDAGHLWEKNAIYPLITL